VREEPGRRGGSVTASRARRLTRAALWGLLVAALVSGVAFLVRAQADPLVRLDRWGITTGTGLARSVGGLRAVLVGWQDVTRPGWLYAGATLLCLWMWLRRGYTTRAWWAFLTMMVLWAVQLGVKELVQRARPVVADALEHAPGYSFPSGHAANAAAAATATVLLLWPVLGRRGRPLAVVAAVVLVVGTALDRVLLGVHYPSDVVAGVLLGCGAVLASYAGYRSDEPPDAAPADAAPPDAAPADEPTDAAPAPDRRS
jgi:undecaprenyl-diphosphatase